jgi:hypothetical protein
MTRSGAKSASSKGAAAKPSVEDAVTVQTTGTPASAVPETAWDRFWFTPISSRPLAWVRIATGLLLILYLASWWSESVAWFGTDGYLSIANSRQISFEQNASPYAYSPLMQFDSPSALRAFHLGSLVVALLFTLGLATRVSGWLALATILAYVHRAPWLAGASESWLGMLLLYLNLAPCGAWYSLDAYFMKHVPMKSWLANLSWRLMQLHTLAFVVIGLGSLIVAKSMPLIVDWPATIIIALATCVGISTWMWGAKFRGTQD